MITVMIVDDQEVVRTGLALLDNTWDDIELIGEATNGLEAVKMCQLLRPDVVLMDIGMPKMDGITATRIIRENCPDTQIIALAGFQDVERIDEAFNAGARYCMLKNIPIDDLLVAIRGIHQ